MRTRVTSWEDPSRLANRARRMDGIAFMRAIAAGELPPPPIAALLGMEVIEVEDGRAVFALEPGEEHYNPIGTVHGGIAATLLDTVTGCAVHTTLPTGAGYTTLDLSVHFVRPVTVGSGLLHAIGEVVHRGRTVATANGRLIEAETGRVVAHGSATLLLNGVREAEHAAEQANAEAAQRPARPALAPRAA